MARRYDEEGAKSAANNAMKNVREALVMYSQLLQSMGCLPKVAVQYEIDRKVEGMMTVSVESESDAECLKKAGEILTKADHKRYQSSHESLH